MNTIDILSKLISFRTISELTNKELAKYISNYLAKYKVKTQLFEDEKTFCLKQIIKENIFVD